MQYLLTPDEVDELFRYKAGRSQRLARRNILPHVTLADGSIRFRRDYVEAVIGRLGDSLQIEDIYEGEVVCAH
jgi:hypothetical protein